MTDRLSLYNSALLYCGERFLSGLTEEREPRRLLDFVWNDGGVKRCLERGSWTFAMRTAQIDYDPSVEPSYGLHRAFEKPADWVRTNAVTTDEFFHTPLLRYVDESGYWFADLDTIYVRYVSQHPDYGFNLAKWTESFKNFVACYFAGRVVLKLSNSTAKLEELMKLEEHLEKLAKSDSAMAEPTKFPAQGAWTRSRQRFPGRRDGGNITGPLIG